MMARSLEKIPHGWARAELGELVEIHDSRRVPLNSDERAFRKGPYPYYGANGQIDTIENYIFDGEFVLLAEDGGYFDDPFKPVAYLATGRFWANNHVHILRLLGEIPPQFLVYFLNFSDLMPFVSGTTRLKLNQSAMRRIPVLVPPLKEQKRIVVRIKDLQGLTRRAREALEPIPDLLGQLRQSVLAAAFRGDLTKEWRAKHPDVESASELLNRMRIQRHKRWEEAELEKLKAKGLTGEKLDSEFTKRCKRYKEPIPADSTDLPELPEGWCWASLSELSSAARAISYGVLQPGDKDEGGVKLVRVCDLKDGNVLIEQLRTIGKEIGEQYERTRLEGGELLVSVVGTIGRLAVAPKEPTLRGPSQESYHLILLMHIGC